MTKLRPPLSVGAALARIAGLLSGDYAEMAAILDRSPGLVRSWGDPDKRERIPMEDAIALDLAYRAAGGHGAPLFECYGAKLDAEGVSWFADEIALARHAATLIRECGDAEAAVVLAAQPGATMRDRQHALREIEEAIGVLASARLMLAGAAPFPTPALAITDVAPLPPAANETHNPPSTGPPR